MLFCCHEMFLGSTMTSPRTSFIRLLNEQEQEDRKKLVKLEYPLPPWGKRVGWCFFLFVTTFCTALILIYGLYFDVKTNAKEDPILSKFLASKWCTKLVFLIISDSKIPKCNNL